MMYQNGARLADGLGFNFTGLYFHCIFMFILVIGVVLLVAWMIKNLKPEKLLLAAIVITVVGLLGALVTIQHEAGFFSRVIGSPVSAPLVNNMMYNRGYDGQPQTDLRNWASPYGQQAQVQPIQLPGQSVAKPAAMMKISTQQTKP